MKRLPPVTPRSDAGQGHTDRRTKRTRIGPRAVDASTTLPCCVISTSPAATSRRAAARVRSISGRQPSGLTRRAASDGQIVFPAPRSASSPRTASSSSRSSADGFDLRQDAEQNRTSSHTRAHFRLQAKRRPQLAQTLSGGCSMPPGYAAREVAARQRSQSGGSPRWSVRTRPGVETLRAA